MPRQRDNPNMMLDVYLLGRVPFETLLALQRRLVYEVSGERGRAVLLLCEHDPLISVGREGSRAQIHFDASELIARGWPIRWVNRGGGCTLHSPGQLAVYAILPLGQLQLDVAAYIDVLRSVLLDVALDASVKAARVGPAEVSVSGRSIAQMGIAVRNWISYFGAVVNINPDLDPFRRVDCCGSAGPMTSLERERRLAVNPALVRERLIERFMERFSLPRVAIHHGHPALPSPPPAAATRLPMSDTSLVFRSLLGADVPEA